VLRAPWVTIARGSFCSQAPSPGRAVQPVADGVHVGVVDDRTRSPPPDEPLGVITRPIAQASANIWLPSQARRPLPVSAAMRSVSTSARMTSTGTASG
jgi:hypothetical protein